MPINGPSGPRIIIEIERDAGIITIEIPGNNKHVYDLNNENLAIEEN